MSYGALGPSGTIVCRDSDVRVGSSVGSSHGGSSMLLEGRKESRDLASSIHSFSREAEKWATPRGLLGVRAPPRSSKETSSPVTVLITLGPVMNMWLVSSTMNMKSVIAGCLLYTSDA